MEYLENQLGLQLSLPARFIIAFVFVLLLIAITAWIIRRVASGRGGFGGSLRARQDRLAVVDATHVDAKRRLVLVRRDNVEHLILIGGPADVVVESGIGASPPALGERGREAVEPLRPVRPSEPARPMRPAEPTLPPRLSDTKPQRPAPVRPPEPTLPPRAAEPPVPPRPAAPPPRPPAPARAPGPDRPAAPPPPSQVAAARVPPPAEPLPRPQRPDAGPAVIARTAAPSAEYAARTAEVVRPSAPPPQARPAAPPPPARPAAPAPNREAQLEEMAQRLEAALKRPLTPPSGGAAPQRPAVPPPPPPPERSAPPPPAAEPEFDLAAAVAAELDLGKDLPDEEPAGDKPTEKINIYDEILKRDT